MDAAMDVPVTEKNNFSADVSRLLDIVANALYASHDVFLRELISNAADACDRLRYESISAPDLIKDNPEFRIHIYKETKARTLTIVDNGIGMTHAELIENLGTIAKSGTAAMMEQAREAGTDNLKLIGQFGVGFYAGFMVANTIKVISRKAGSTETWTWESDGRTGFETREAVSAEKKLLNGMRGTAIVLSIKDSASEFLMDKKISDTVERYSDHISIPVYLGPPETFASDTKPMNAASALWMRPKSEITAEQYDEFYRHITHGLDEPLMTSHWRAEGKIEYSALLFIPTLRPWDLYDPTRKGAVRLYVRRVFINDSVDGLMYPWLRFVRGVIDSEDLPLNVSRDTLQHNPIIAKIRSGVTKRVLSDLDKLSRDDAPAFVTFWGQFGSAIKEGLYDAPEFRDDILKICRFYSTHDNGEKFTGLEDYFTRMKPDQNEIYYLSGENLESLKTAPQIEAFRANGIEVLFFTDTIDDFWLQAVGEYKGKKFKSVTRGDINFPEATQKESAPTPEKDNTEFLSRIEDILKSEIQSVRASKRLKESAVCLVAADAGVDMNMERVLKIHQKYQPTTKPVLEINMDHALIKKIAGMADENKNGDFENAVKLLLDQAKILQSIPLADAAGFARRMSMFMTRAI